MDNSPTQFVAHCRPRSCGRQRATKPPHRKSRNEKIKGIEKRKPAENNG